MRSRQRLPRVAAWALLALAVLLSHGLLLRALLDQAAPQPAAAPRLIALALAPTPTPTPTPTPVAADAPAPAPPAIGPTATPPSPPRSPSPLRPPRAAHPAPAPSTLAAGAAAAPVDAADIGTAATPVYPTRLPDAASLHYRLQRGQAVGSARLQWQRDADGYVLRLDTAWPGQPAAGSASRGVIDADGVAPLRHAELRRAREVRAANFQREIGRITFSGPQRAYALPPGAQDRLSWLMQLPGIVAADPALRRAGASVTLFVVGTRGDAEAWRFEVLGAEGLALPAGTIADALRLKREPTRPYDSRVEVWLDPARQHLPVRALFTTLPGGEPLQMELAAAEPELEISAAGPK